MQQQATTNTVRLASPTDAQVIEFLAEVASLSQSPSFQFSSLGTVVGQFPDSATALKSSPDGWSKTRVINSGFVQIQPTSISLHFSRSVATFEANGNVERSVSEFESEVWVQSNPQAVNPTDVFLELRSLISRFKSASMLELRSGSASRELTRVFAKQIADLGDLQTTMLRDAEEHRRNAERLLSEREAQMDAEVSEKKIQLEGAAERERVALAKRESELEERRKELDDRGHMHARRQLRSEITKDLKTRLARPGVSARVQSLRYQTMMLAALGMMAFAGYAAYAAIDIHNILSRPASPSEATLIFASARFLLPASAAAGLLFYLLSWLKQLHNEDASTERDLEHYLYDVDRASWAIETILEAQEKEAASIPEKWIEGATHGLFAREAGHKEDRSPLDAIGSLLNIAAKAEFGPAGPRIELSRGGLKKLGKIAEGEG